MSLPPQNPYTAVQPMNPSDERLWATLIHLGGIILYFLSPLIGLLVLGPRGPFVRAHAVEALNFQISILIYYVALIFVSIITLGIGALLYVPLGILALVFMIMAAVAANRGEYYKYPLTITFVR